MLTRIVSPSNSDWQSLLDTIPHDFYHLPGYLELEAKRYNATAEAIVIEDGAAVFFLPYLIRDCSHLLDSHNHRSEQIYDVISPYGYPGILINRAGQNPEFLRKCLELTYDCWQQNNICSAFIRLHPLLNSYIDSSFDDLKFVFRSQGDVITCDLSKNTDQIFKQIRSSHRTKINKLGRNGFTVRIIPIDDRYLDIFTDIYRETMDRVNATSSYYFTRDYFQKLCQILGDRIHLCIVEKDRLVVAASLVTEVRGIVQYHLGGTKNDFLRQSPATMMFKYMIEWSKQRNNQYLNLGGGLGGSQDSLYHFKLGFSQEIRSFVTVKIIVNAEKYTQLIYSTAKSTGVPTAEIQTTSFFPAYRATLVNSR